MAGPSLRFAADAVVALAGADMTATLDDVPVAFFEPIAVKAGQTLKLGAVGPAGVRSPADRLLSLY